MGFERGAITTLMLRPLLSWEAVRSWFALRRKGGYTISSAYLAWRRATAYGDESTTMSAQDLADYLSWRREVRRIRKWVREA